MNQSFGGTLLKGLGPVSIEDFHARRFVSRVKVGNWGQLWPVYKFKGGFGKAVLRIFRKEKEADLYVKNAKGEWVYSETVRIDP